MRKQLITAGVIAAFGVALVGAAPPASAAQHASVYSCVKGKAGAKAAARYKAGKPTAADKKVIKACKGSGSGGSGSDEVVVAG